MRVLTVAKRDLRSARRSKTLWVVAICLAVIAALVAYTHGHHRSTGVEVVQSVLRNLAMILAVVLPIVALVASYLAIAGEREGGGIKFLLAMPNSRREVFAGKLLSRAGVIAFGVLYMFITAVSMSLTIHGAFPATVVVGLFALTVVYGSVFVSVGVAMSSMVATRSRAIAGALASYFVLVILYIFPVVNVADIVRWFHHTMLGMDRNPDLYDAVTYTSPFIAYQKAMNLVMPERLEITVFSRQSGATAREGPSAIQQEPDLPAYLGDEISLVVFAFWLVVPLAIGYWRFERADLE